MQFIVAFLNLAGQESLLDNFICWLCLSLVIFGIVKLAMFVLRRYLK